MPEKKLFTFTPMSWPESFKFALAIGLVIFVAVFMTLLMF